MKIRILFVICLLTNHAYTQLSFEWANGIGSATQDEGMAITHDSQGNVYTTGYFTGSVDFDPGPGTLILNAALTLDIYVAKFDSSGNILWAKGMGNAPNNDRGLGISLDADGNAFVTGVFFNTVDFDPGPGVFNMTSAGGSDVFVLKLDSNGNFIWAKRIGGVSTDSGESIYVDNNGYVYTAGSYATTVDFDPGAGVFNLTAVGNNDAFIQKLDNAGNFVWAKSMGGTYTDNILSISVSDSGNIYTTGFFGNTSDFDPGPGVYNLTGMGSTDIFISKLNSLGNFVWAKQVSGYSAEMGRSVKVDSLENVYAAGFYEGAVDFDPGSGTYYSVPIGNYDAFVLKLNNSGNFVWAKNFGHASSNDECRSLEVTSSGSVYVIGHFGYTVDFDPGPGVYNIVCGGWTDIFLLKLNNNGDFVWATNMPGPSMDVGLSISADDNGNIYYTGSFVQTVDFDPGPGSYPLASNASSIDIVVSKLCQIPVSPVSISGPDSVCLGDTVLYSILPVPDALDYSWTLPGGWSGTSNTTSINAVVGLNSGNIAVTANSGCGSSLPAIKSVTSITIPAAPDTILGPTTICTGLQNIYHTPLVPNATSYNWSLPLGWAGNSLVDSILAIPGTHGGNILVSATNMCGTSATDSLIILVDSLPPVAPTLILGDDSICVGSTNVYRILPSPGASSYTWTLPSGWTGASMVDSIITIATLSNGNIIVTANNACGNIPGLPLFITVDSIPAMTGVMSGNNPICAGSVQTFSIVPVSGASAYTWTLPLGWTGSSNSDTISVMVDSLGGTISVIANNTCGFSTPVSMFVYVDTAAASLPGMISGPDTICAGSNNIFNVPASTGIISYLWTLPAGWTGSSVTNSISTTASSTSGNISVVATNGCGTSSPQYLPVAINNIPSQPSSIFANSIVCAGITQDIFVTVDTNATSYLWNLPFGWIGSSVSDSIYATPGISGTISVNAVNDCGISLPQTFNIIVSNPILNVLPTSVSCYDSCDGNISVNTLGGVGGYTYFPFPLTDFCAGSYNITVVDSAGCIATDTAVILEPNMIISNVFSTDSILCNGDCTNLNVMVSGGSPGYNYMWMPGSFTGNVISICPTNNITYTCTITDTNNCVRTDSVHILVNEIPIVTINVSDTNLCIGESIILEGEGANSYLWTGGVNNGISFVPLMSTIYTVTGTDINSCSNTASVMVNVNTLPSVSFNYLGNDTVCIDDGLQLLNGGTPSGGVYSGPGVTALNFDPLSAGVGTHTINYFYTDINSCAGTDNYLITVLSCLGIDYFPETSISVYPNPFTSQVNIVGVSEFAEVKLYSTIGELIGVWNLNEIEKSFQTTNLDQGVYFVHIITLEGIFVKRIIKQD